MAGCMSPAAALLCSFAFILLPLYALLLLPVPSCALILLAAPCSLHVLLCSGLWWATHLWSLQLPARG
jgi:hypothetical protein